MWETSCPAILQKSWEQRRPKLSNDQLRTRRAAAEQALDDLLEEFVQQGYRVEMSKQLQEIVNNSLLDFELHEVYVLSRDLDVQSRLWVTRSPTTTRMKPNKKPRLMPLLST